MRGKKSADGWLQLEDSILAQNAQVLGSSSQARGIINSTYRGKANFYRGIPNGTYPNEGRERYSLLGQDIARARAKE
jgi:hypothetical protein